MDGPAHVTQCPVPPGSSFTYKFWLDQAGTYWYHSHTGSQYPDGLRGAFIVKDQVDPYAKDHDDEYLLTTSDWYVQQVPALLANTVFNKTNVQIRPPLPQGGLINDGKGATYKFVPGKKYKFRIINMSAFTGVFIHFEGHDFDIVEVDGVNVQKKNAKLLFVTPAQRYSIIIEAKSDKAKNFGVSAIFDVNPNFRAPVIPFNINATGTLEYDASLGPAPQSLIQDFSDLIDDTTIKSIDLKALGKTDVKIEMDFNLGIDATGTPRAFVNGKPYVHQKVPTLYTALTTGDDALKPEVYGQVNPFIVKKNQVVELIVRNSHFAHHPFHFHGHHFQVCHRGAGNSGSVSGVDCTTGTPSERDVITIEGNSTAILRFKATNPGVWIFHCHIEWHVPLGLTATIIEDPIAIQNSPTIKIPADHLAACKANCFPTKGNAGGNTKDHADESNYATAVDFDHGAVFEYQDCPAENGTIPTSSATEWTTSTLYSTRTYTVTSCAPTVTNCHNGGKNGSYVTEVVPYTTTVCPVTQTKPSHSKPTFDIGVGEAVPWPDFYSHSAYSKTTVYTVTTSGKPYVKTDVIQATSTAPLGAAYGTGVGVVPVGTGKAKPVTAGAAKAASGFGAAAVAGLLALALL